MPFNWNLQQLAAIDGIIEYIKRPFVPDNPQTWAIGIRGYAGTGKTTLIQEALRRCLAGEVNETLRIAVTAPTNKAVKVLRSFGRDAGVTVDARTIYSLLGLVLGSEGEKRSVFQGSDGSLGDYDVVVIDECSMCGETLMNTLYDAIERTGTKVIFMGDQGQLNPVNEKVSRTFNPVEVPEFYQLTKIERIDSGNPIEEVVNSVRLWTESPLNPPQVRWETTLNDGDDGYHVMPNMGDFQEAMLDQFDCEEYRNDSTFCRVLAWTNREVDRLNRLIRARLYGPDAPQYVVGEDIAALTPVMSESGSELLIATDDEVTITSVAEAQFTDTSDFQTYPDRHPVYAVWVLTVKDSEGFFHRIRTLHAASQRQYNNRCEFLANNAKRKVVPWKKFWEFKALFTEVRPVHAMTIHKSQGQTFNTTFVNTRDALKNKNPRERASLIYVALSRSTTNLVFNSSKFN